MEWMSKLREPFHASEIEWRIQSSGKGANGIWAKVLAYVTNRAIQDRLDDVFGVDGWQNSLVETPSGFICGIGVRVRELATGSEWAWKFDGADKSDIEPYKGGISGAMKRAAVQWGIGRYLYNLDEGWAVITDSGKFSAKTKEGDKFKWNPPELPKWALPGGETAPKNAPEGPQEARGETLPPKPGKDPFHCGETLVKAFYADVKKAGGGQEDMVNVVRALVPEKVSDGKILFSKFTEGEYNTICEAFAEGKNWRALIEPFLDDMPVM